METVDGLLEKKEEDDVINDAHDDNNININSSNSNKLDQISQQSGSGSLDYYQILGVSRTATEKEIMDAYENLSAEIVSSKASSNDGSNNNESEAVRRIEEINEAYGVLGDPYKRQVYNNDGRHVEIEHEQEGVDVRSLGRVGRMFGAIVGRLGLPIPTQIAQDVLDAAKEICRDNGIIGGGPPMDKRVLDLVWGWSIDSKVDSQGAAFFRITVDKRQANNGFIVFCRSLKGKFKLIMFDSEGSVLHHEECQRSRDNSQYETAFYFTSKDIYHLEKPPPPAVSEQDIPSLFFSLDQFSKCNLPSVEGQFLLCVYGDNFIGKTHFSLLAVPMLSGGDEINVIQGIDREIIDKRKDLHSFKEEYLQAKEAYELAIRRLHKESMLVEGLIEKREFAYSSFVVESANAYLPSIEESDIHPVEMEQDENPDDIQHQIATSAAAATTWMSSAFSSGFEQIQKMLQPASNASSSTNSTASSGKQVNPYLMQQSQNEREMDTSIIDSTHSTTTLI